MRWAAMEQIKLLLVELLVMAIVWWAIRRLSLPAPVIMVVEVGLAILLIYFVITAFGVHLPRF